jgi:hypothetical protein
VPAYANVPGTDRLKGEEMRKLAVILAPLIILAITLALVGCGGEESPTPTPSPTQAPTATPAKTATPAATATPTAAPTATPAPPPTVTPVGANPPCRFHGTVKLNGANVADGIVITAIISGDEFTTETPAVYGASTYAIKIVPSQSAAYSEGAIISFKIGNYTANQTGSWETGGNIELNLTASTTT